MHKVVNGQRVRLTQEEIAAIEVDEAENLREAALYQLVVGRSEAFGDLSQHIERISKTLAYLK